MAGVDVDFQKKTALVTMQAGHALTRSQCESAFADTRYTVLRFEAEADARRDTQRAGPGT